MTPAHLLAFAASFALVSVCSALALDAGANPLTVVTARTAQTVVLLLLWFRLVGVSLAVPASDFARAGAIAIPLTLNNYLLNAAFGLIPVPLAVLIFYLWPAISTLASWLLKRDRFRLRSAFGLTAAFAAAS